MASSLSNLVDNLSERIHRIKGKKRYDDKNARLLIHVLQLFS